RTSVKPSVHVKARPSQGLGTTQSASPEMQPGAVSQATRQRRGRRRSVRMGRERSTRSARGGGRGEEPNRAYFRACQGSWRSPLALRVTDPSALAASGMSWTDRLGMRALAAWSRWLGALTLDTTVIYDPAGVVAHTTVVRWLGV